MADINPNIKVNIDTSNALASLRALQGEISKLSKELKASSALNAQQAENFQRNLIADINATGKFSASIRTIQSSTESFTSALEKNKLSLGQYFKYGMASTKTFGSMFKNEMGVLDKVARERVKTLQTQFISMGRDASGALKAIAVRPLRLDLNDLATQQAMNAQKQQIFNQLLKQGSTNLLNFGKNTQWAGRQLMVGFTIPLSIFGSQASKAFMNLEEQAIRFKRVYGELFTPPEEAGQMLDTLKELGNEFTKYGVSVRDTLSLAADAAAMGKTGAELAAQVTEATRLAVLGEVSQQQALETSISLTNAFGYAADELASKINFLNAVENQTVVSIEDLTIAIPKAAPVIKQLGGGVEDLAFFLTAMKEGGINASEGANALKSGIASLINPTTQASDLMMSFGINIRELVRQNAGDAKGMIIAVATALDKLAPQQRAQAIEQMFGKFQFARISTLFSNVISEGNQANRVLELMGSSASDLAQLSEKELSRVEESTTYKFRGAIEEFNAALAPIGEEFLKLITPIIEVGTKILESFNKMSDGGKQFITGLTVVLGAVAPVALMTFGLIANGVANLLKGFATLRSLFLGLGKDTGTLGQQTDYMTQQQLEAAAAAASLEQIHNNLVQTFTVERDAVRMLGNEYYQAGIKLAAMRGGRAIPTMFDGMKKYADGGLIVGPGSGTSDSIPAMVSNGEFIMNAKRTEQYLPLLQLMAKGKLPGFASPEGGTLVGGSVAGYNIPQGSSVRANSEAAIEALVRKFERLGNSTDDIQRLFDRLEGSISATSLNKAATAEDSGIVTKGPSGGRKMNWGHLESNVEVDPVTGERISGSLVRKMPATQNAKLKTGQPIEEFEADWMSVTGGLYKTVELGGEKLTDGIKKATDEIDDQIGKIAIGLAKDGVITDEIVDQATRIAIEEARKRGGDSAKVADALDNTRNKKVRMPATAETWQQVGISHPGESQRQTVDRLTRSGRVTQRGRDFVTDDKTLSSSGILARLSSGGQFRPAHRTPEGTTRSDTYLGFGSATEAEMTAAGKQLKKDAKVESPSKETKQATKGMVQGVTETIKKSKKDVAKATQEMIGDTPRKIKNVGGRRVTNNPKLIAEYEQKQLASVQNLFKQSPAAPQLIAPSVDKVAEANAQFSNFSSKMSRATMGISAVTGILSMFGGELSEVNGILFQLSTVAFGAIQVLEMMPSKVGAALATRWANKFTATTAGVTGIFGKLKAGVLGVLRFLGPVGIGLSLLAVAIPFVVKLYNDQKAKMEAFGNIVDVTADQVKYLGEQAGVSPVTSGGFGDISSEKGVNQAKAEEMAATDEFKEQFSKQINAVKFATADVAVNALEMFAYYLSSTGLPDTIVSETIAGIIAASERKDVKFNFSRVGVSEENKQQILNDIKTVLDNNQLEQEVTITNTQTGQFRETDQVAVQNNIDRKNAIKQQGDAAGLYLDAIGAAFRGSDRSKEDIDTFKQGFTDLQAIVDSLDPDRAEAFMEGLLSNITDEPVRNLISSMGSLEDQMSVLEAWQSGLVETNDLIEISNGLNKQFAVDGPAAAIANAQARQKLNDLLQYSKTIEKELADFQRDAALAAIGGIEAQTASVQGQITAYDRMVAAGLDGAEAYRIVGDQALYTAYQEAEAAGMLDEFIKSVEKFREITGELEKRAPVTVSSAAPEKTDFQKALEALQGQRDAANDTYVAYKRLRNAGFDVATAAKAAGDATLAAGLASVKVGSQKWTNLINEINETNAALERTEALLEAISLATPEGKTEKFMDGYNKAMDAFSAKETQIELKFNVDNKATMDTIKTAERQIATYNYNLDDFEAGITEIEIKEKDVNEKYDERIKALDKVSKINDKLAKQQKAQLSIADALSQGDIAAAARAVQEQRAQEAQQAIEDQKTALEEQRQISLGRLTASSGLTRAELETKIADTKQLIFDLEEKTLEPAQRALELATNIKEDQIAALTVLGLTRAQWEETKNKIDIARTSSAQYIDDMQAALDIVQAAVDAWNSIESKEVTLTIIENRVSAGGSGGGGSPTTTGDPKPTTKTTGTPLTTIKEKQTAIDSSKARVDAIDTKINARAAVITSPKTAPDMKAALQKQNAADAYTKSWELKAQNALNQSIAKDKSKSAAGVGGGSRIGFGALARGGLISRSFGSDIVPTLLTPGEFVISRPAVRNFGIERLKAINSGADASNSVYNYNLTVNAKSNANADDIAQTVMTQIRRINSQQIRSARY